MATLVNPSKEEREAFVKKLEERMNDEGLTKQDLAKELRLSTSTVYSWKYCSLPSAHNAVALCDFFGVTVEELFGRDQAKQYHTTWKKKQKIHPDRLTPGHRLQRDIDNYCAEKQVRTKLPYIEEKVRDLRLEKLKVTSSKISQHCRGELIIPYEWAVIYAHVLGTDARRYFRETIQEKHPPELAPEPAQEDVQLQAVQTETTLQDLVHGLTDTQEDIIRRKINGFSLAQIAQQYKHEHNGIRKSKYPQSNQGIYNVLTRPPQIRTPARPTTSVGKHTKKLVRILAHSHIMQEYLNDLQEQKRFFSTITEEGKTKLYKRASRKLPAPGNERGDYINSMLETHWEYKPLTKWQLKRFTKKTTN